MSSVRAAGLVLGFLADQALGDPPRWHPVAGFGHAASWFERRIHADSHARGAAYTAALVGAAAGTGYVAERATRGRPVARTLLVAVTTWTVLGGRSLEREARTVGRLLDEGDLPAARIQLTHLVGRDPSQLSVDEVARATVESVAENTSDAVVAPLLAGALFGVPGLLAYRAANTLDAMVGYRSPRFSRFGWASARLDDVLNLLPARLAGALTVGAAPLVGGRASQVLRAWAADASSHPSPNAGAVEAAFAGALGLRLGGRNVYDGRVEDRPTMGTGRSPRPADIERSTRLATFVSWGALAASVSAALMLPAVSRLLRRPAH